MVSTLRVASPQCGEMSPAVGEQLAGWRSRKCPPCKASGPRPSVYWVGVGTAGVRGRTRPLSWSASRTEGAQLRWRRRRRRAPVVRGASAVRREPVASSGPCGAGARRPIPHGCSVGRWSRRRVSGVPSPPVALGVGRAAGRLSPRRASAIVSCARPMRRWSSVASPGISRCAVRGRGAGLPEERRRVWRFSHRCATIGEMALPSRCRHCATRPSRLPRGRGW